MKKLLLFLIIVVPFSLFSQTSVYHPFPDSSAVWVYEQGTCLNPSHNPPCTQMDYHIYYYSLNGDTIAGSILYHKLYIMDSSAVVPIGTGLMGGIREDSIRKVFFTDFLNPEQLIYDFSSTNVGDTIVRGYYYCKGVISSIDSIQLDDGQWRKRYTTNACDWPAQVSYVIEGIGSNYDLIRGPVGAEYAGWSLRCFHKNDSLVYIYDTSSTASCYMDYDHLGVQEQQNSFSFSISPNPSTGNFTINSSEKLQYSVYDIFGREILQSTIQNQSAVLDLTSYSRGIYFVRGRANDKMFARKIILQ